MLETFRLMLRAADQPGPEALLWSHAALERLPAEPVDWLIGAGILGGAEPDMGALCCECEEMCRVKPEIITDVATGRKRAFLYCAREGPIWFGMDAFNRRKLRLDRLAQVVAEAAGCIGSPVELVPERLWLLGTVPIDGKARELFLARGLAWPDARKVLGQCARLRASACPAVLTLAGMPSGDLVPGQKLPVRPIAELVRFDSEAPRVSLDGAFPEAEPSPWTDIPNDPITLDAFMARYCEKRSREVRRYRRQALLAAARNGTRSHMVKRSAVQAAAACQAGGPETKLPHELARAKRRLRKATVTFTNLGRLHAFLQSRGTADDSPVTAPLAALRYIHRLERMCRAAKQVVASPKECRVTRPTMVG